MMIIQNTFTVIPLILLLTLNITLFGFFYGYMWSWFTSVAAAVIVFLIVRGLFQDVLLQKGYSGMKDKIEQNGFMYVLIGRIFPFVPTSIINIAAGLSTVRFNHFLLATAVGNLIYFFILSLIPLGFLSKKFDQYILVALSTAAILAFVGYKLCSRKKRNKISHSSIHDK
ncbi:TVP38/TMEM64 family protein [Bacillus taeanensis]|nr:VTT domain-containing protein [Bacillus taeanensis]